MPTTATRIIVNAKTGESITETYEIPDPTPEELAAAALAEQERIKLELANAVQAHLDAKARERNYDGILSLCTYATSTNTMFAVEGQAGSLWRDACWAKCYEVMSEVAAGTRPVPTAVELIAELPIFTWGE